MDCETTIKPRAQATAEREESVLSAALACFIQQGIRLVTSSAAPTAASAAYIITLAAKKASPKSCSSIR